MSVPLADYTFPTARLRPLHNPAKQPVALVACGSFSPITHLHLRMFEMAADFARQNTDFEVVAGYLSPVSDAYEKAGLLTAAHRVNMCNIAAAESAWLMVDPWEAFQEYQRTAVVLAHFDAEINGARGGVEVEGEPGTRRAVRVMLLAGSDLLSTMSEPGVWSADDIAAILGRHGALIIERAGADTARALESDALARWRTGVHLVAQTVQNDVSSTKVRLFLRRGLSVRYLLPAGVIDYIEQNGLYIEEGAGVVQHHPSDGEGAAPGKS